ncbi:Glucan endo-1,3-beta-glucosidase precursor [Grimontia celer]|uniref:Glucan endo-1,3-beta-glucosidase n=2 Tax=Grimontia celer TaxID=1796497 RepID=A0A128F480_9GAMM|nr:Glucan endo-1,3-beta-glucosidase precursor [Grimontia celer]
MKPIAVYAMLSMSCLMNSSVLATEDTNQNDLNLSTKNIAGEVSHIFRDEYGRETILRGFNVSGSVKLHWTGFKPFVNANDAAFSFEQMRNKTGSNVVRFTVAWEGVHPEVDYIDQNYVDEVIAQMREAIKRDMYVIVDFHADLYSRHTFIRTDRITGNGAPEWIVRGGGHGRSGCSAIGSFHCLSSWFANLIFNDTARAAQRDFWLNSSINTTAGERKVQDEFLWQMSHLAEAIKDQLTEEEFQYVLGIEPINEPSDGGIHELGINNHAEFDNQFLWPFYQRVRTSLNTLEGWENKWVFAEPLVFWNTPIPLATSETGGGYLETPPGEGFVFSAHYYDSNRRAFDLSTPRNASYFRNLDFVRNESDFLEIPVILTEFGAPNGGFGHTDNHRLSNATYQAMEISDRKSGTDRFVDFHTTMMSGTHWQWDHNYDNHQENIHNNPDLFVSATDAWNGEDFSVIRNFSQEYTVDERLVERLYPRKVQGDLIAFHFNAIVRDRWNDPLDWAILRVDLPDVYEDRPLFADTRFALMTWQGKALQKPTEMFIPGHMNPSSAVLVTDWGIVKGLTEGDLGDGISVTGQGTGIMLNLDRQDDDVHFALIVESTDHEAISLKELQTALKNNLLERQESVVYLPGQMTHGGYPEDHSRSGEFSLVNQATGLCLDVAGGFTFNGTNVQSYPCNNTNAQRWIYDEQNHFLRSSLDRNQCLDIGGDRTQGTNVKIWNCNDFFTQNRHFSFNDNVLEVRGFPNLSVSATSDQASSNVVLGDPQKALENAQWLRVYR